MNTFLARLAHKLFLTLENAALDARMAALRRAGHGIADDLRIGRRVQIDVHDGASLAIERNVEILQDSWIIAEGGDVMRIGRNVFISQHCTISGSVDIGDDTLIAGYVTILDANHVFDRLDLPVRLQGGRKAPIRIGSDVWIGAHAVVLPGVSIGDHAVIGANSTVTADIPPLAVAAGSPARIIRMREPA